jgi:hypothetical protein
MQWRPANILPTVLLSLANLMLILNIWLFTILKSFPLTLWHYLGVISIGVLFGIAGVVTQFTQPRQPEGAGKQRVSLASSGFLFVLFLVLAAGELIILALITLVLLMLEMASGGTLDTGFF